MATIYTKADIDPGIVQGRKVAVIGYGNQGRAQTLNLRDSGVKVVVGQRTGGPGWDSAMADGLAPVSMSDAADQGEIVMLALPDESMADIYDEHVAPAMKPGKTLLVCHGYALHFGFLKPRDDIDVALAAPKGSGATLRKEVSEGRSLTGLVAVHQDATGSAQATALSYLSAIGCGKTVIGTTVEEECVTDLFGEQAVLCGGIPDLIKAAYDTLVEAGYSPESAYIECLHEAKLITDLLYERGLSGMREAISDTAEWGGYQAGTRLIDETVRKRMSALLLDIRSGKFAKGWDQESSSGKKELLRLRHEESRHPVEDVGRRLRKLMPDVEDGGS